MATDPIVFAMANPTPEVRPEAVRGDVAIMATGRSDYPNQINNVLAFPGIFRGALDVRATEINEPMKLAAARRSPASSRRATCRRTTSSRASSTAGGRGGRHGGRRGRGSATGVARRGDRRGDRDRAVLPSLRPARGPAGHGEGASGSARSRRSASSATASSAWIS
jgi:malic enzyme